MLMEDARSSTTTSVEAPSQKLFFLSSGRPIRHGEGPVVSTSQTNPIRDPIRSKRLDSSPSQRLKPTQLCTFSSFACLFYTHFVVPPPPLLLHADFLMSPFPSTITLKRTHSVVLHASPSYPLVDTRPGRRAERIKSLDNHTALKNGILP